MSKSLCLRKFEELGASQFGDIYNVLSWCSMLFCNKKLFRNYEILLKISLYNNKHELFTMNIIFIVMG